VEESKRNRIKKRAPGPICFVRSQCSSGSNLRFPAKNSVRGDGKKRGGRNTKHIALSNDPLICSGEKIREGPREG